MPQSHQARPFGKYRSACRSVCTYGISLALFVCMSLGMGGYAKAAADADIDAAQWSSRDFETVYRNYLMHYTGGSYDVWQQRFTSLESAQAARNGPDRTKGVEKHHWDSLLDAPEFMRSVLLSLREGDVSQPVEYRFSNGLTTWYVLRLVKTSDEPLMARSAAFKERALQWWRKGLIPAPQALREDGMFMRADAMFSQLGGQEVPDNLPRVVDQLRSQAKTKSLDPVNFRLPSGGTPLVTALAGKRYRLATALLDHGADPNFCGVTSCPLSVSDLPQSMMSTLLARGAQVNQHEENAGWARFSPLYLALLNRNDTAVEFLLEHGADVVGSSSEEFPLGAAAVMHSKRWISALLEKGASPVLQFAPNEANLPSMMLMSVVERDADPAFGEWLLQQCQGWAAKRSEYRFEAWIEQGGKRFEINGKPLKLKPQPFDLVVIPGGVDLNLGASFDPKWLAEVKQQVPGNMMFSYGGASATEIGGKDLFIYDARPSGSREDDGWGGFLNLPATEGSEQDAVYSAVRKMPDGRRALVKSFASVFEVSEDKSKQRESRAIANLAGKTVYMAIGARLTVGMYTPLMSSRNAMLVFGKK